MAVVKLIAHHGLCIRVSLARGLQVPEVGAGRITVDTVSRLVNVSELSLRIGIAGGRRPLTKKRWRTSGKASSLKRHHSPSRCGLSSVSLSPTEYQ